MLWQDVRHAIRRIRRAPITFATIVVLMACGVAASTSLFSVIDGVLFKPLPFPEPERLVAIGSSRPESAGRPGPLSVADLDDLDAQNLLPLAYYQRDVRPGDRDDQASTSALAAVSGAFFDVLGVQPWAGRLLTEDDASAAAPRPMVLSHAEWQRQFASDESIVDRVVDWGADRFVVVGIAPPRVDFPAGAGAWIPLARPESDFERRFASLETIGRLPAGRPLSSMAAARPDLTFQGLREYVRPGGTTGLMLLLLATTLVLIVAWVHVAALQLSKADEVLHEMRIRLALGAARRHLIGHRMAEGLCIAVGTLGLAWLAVPATTALVGSQLPAAMIRGLPIATDGRVFLFGLFLSVLGVAALVAVPLSKEWRSDALGVLRAARGPGTGQRTRQALLVAQVAVTAALLYVAGLSARSYAELQRMDIGFSVRDVLAVRLPSRGLRDDPARTLQEGRALVDTIRRVPGVVSASAGAPLPFGGRIRVRLSTLGAPPSAQISAAQVIVEPGYFSTLGIPLVDGRSFARTDDRGQPLAVIVSQQVASQLRTEGVGVGSTLSLNGLPARLVGVAADTRQEHPAIAPEPHVYVPAAQWFFPSHLLARLGRDAPAATARLLDARLMDVWPNDAARPVPVSLESRLQATLADVRGRTALLGLSAAIALGMTLLGIWGSVTAATQSRRPELAIRLVCGADPRTLAASVVATALRSVLVGLLCGLVLAAIAARVMAALFLGVGSVDAMTVAYVFVAVVAITLVSAVVPAWRAARIEPAHELRNP